MRWQTCRWEVKHREGKATREVRSLSSHIQVKSLHGVEMKVRCLEKAIKRLRKCYGETSENMEFVSVEERDNKIVFVGKTQTIDESLGGRTVIKGDKK